jgi:hypothetical protein
MRAGNGGLPVSGRAELGKICGDLLQIFEFKKMFDPNDVHGNDGPPTAGYERCEKRDKHA